MLLYHVQCTYLFICKITRIMCAASRAIEGFSNDAMIKTMMKCRQIVKTFSGLKA